MNGDSKQPVILFGFPVLRLFGVDNTDDPNLDQAPDVRGRVHKHHDIERIAVVCERRGNEAKVELDLSPILRQTVKTQISLNGELSHGIVPKAVH
jgi:hypothetical protein